MLPFPKSGVETVRMATEAIGVSMGTIGTEAYVAVREVTVRGVQITWITAIAVVVVVAKSCCHGDKSA